MRPPENWKHAILTILLFVSAENTGSLHAQEGDLRHAFLWMF
jgi:hypothetical protein